MAAPSVEPCGLASSSGASAPPLNEVACYKPAACVDKRPRPTLVVTGATGIASAAARRHAAAGSSVGGAQRSAELFEAVYREYAPRLASALGGDG